MSMTLTAQQVRDMAGSDRKLHVTVECTVSSSGQIMLGHGRLPDFAPEFMGILEMKLAPLAVPRDLGAVVLAKVWDEAFARYLSMVEPGVWTDLDGEDQFTSSDITEVLDIPFDGIRIPRHIEEFPK